MAATGIRLRRSLSLASSILNHHRNLSYVTSVAAPPSSAPSAAEQMPSLLGVTRSVPNSISFQFMFSRTFSSRPRYNNDNNMDGDQISPDAILFEGCDYNHWLITMDFPKDPAPTPEEMVETYVQTAAKVLGSVEEAKKKIYACSTNTYNGFQVEVTEEVSEKFNGLPGVVFVLPDSYIDPVNKEYGGDKYINGTIIPRPPPVQFGRQRGRFNDRNRDYNRPQSGPQHNYGDRMPMNNAPGGQGNYQGDRRGSMPSYQADYSQGARSNLNPPGQSGFSQMDQRDVRGEGRTFAPPRVGNYNQQGGGNYQQGPGGQFGQGGGAGYGQGTGGQFGHGGQGTGGQFGHGGQGTGGQTGPGPSGSHQQGRGGNYDQGTGGQGQYSPVAVGGSYGPGDNQNFGQGVAGAYGHGQNSSQYGGNPSFPQVGQGQQENYEFMNEAGDNHGRQR